MSQSEETTEAQHRVGLVREGWPGVKMRSSAGRSLPAYAPMATSLIIAYLGEYPCGTSGLADGMPKVTGRNGSCV
jgi:hypothetical protein